MQKPSDLNPEKINQVQTAYFFDVDSVITDPKEKKITEPRILNLIINLLHFGDFVAFNSGRDTNWVKQNVLEPLTQRIKEKQLLKDILVVGEKGTSLMKFDGQWHENIDKNYALPDELKEKLKEFVLTTKSMFYDENKHNMVTLEMKDEYDIEEFVRERDTVLPKVKEIVNKYKNMVTEPTSIDIDIQHKDSGKHLGAKHILDFFSANSINPSHFITVGDSTSDLEMADELHAQGKSVEFWYVNPSKPFAVEKPYPIKVSKKEFSAGTVEMLEEFSSK